MEVKIERKEYDNIVNLVFKLINPRENNRLIGIMYTIRDKKHIEIINIAIMDEYRKNGYGKYLVSLLVRYMIHGNILNYPIMIKKNINPDFWDHMSKSFEQVIWKC